MARNSGAKRIRIMQDGLIDEEGQRWDRIRSGNYYLTPADVVSLGHVSRFVTTGSYGTPAVEVTRADVKGHEELPSGGHENCPLVAMGSAQWQPPTAFG